MTNKTKVIRDCIHGDIKINGIFVELMETPELQRLYNIKQLGLAHLVFPGAHHTRLEHSLGTFYLATKVADLLEIEDYEKLLLGCASLLHDIGHGPFSHTLETIIRNSLGVDHIDLTEKLIIGKYEIFYPDEKEFISSDSVSSILVKNGLEPKEIVEIVRGIKNDRSFLSQIVNSSIDVDQLDYLMRDAYYTGVAYGIVDIERFIQTLCIFDHEFSIKRKGVGVVESILMARSLMYSSVYFHKTVRIAELMLSKAIENIYGVKPFDFFKMNDYEIISYLKGIGKYQNKIVTCIKYRKLFKQAYTLTFSELEKEKLEILEKLEEPQYRIDKEREIEDKLNIEPGHVIIDVPLKELQYAEPRINQTNFTVFDNGKIRNLDYFTPVAKAIRFKSVPDWYLMIVTESKYRDIVKDKAEKILFN